MAEGLFKLLSWVLCLGLIAGIHCFQCPNNPENGYWDKDSYRERCILRCFDGFEPSDCHVLRPVRGGREWNRGIPDCQEASTVSGKTILAVGVGTAAAVVGVPAVLAGAGFTAAGVAAGSLAAWLQTPFTAAGGWFAASQSAGVLGAAASTKAGVGTFTGLVTHYFSSGNCEKE
ncbi:interferon alpha-inducible protein 27-like protein 2B [Saccostrea echinata]|uniref:interferon alpha-inducible protein 27-like protein 2B n=1 Tax=Saccostrea echinata TaxID=191078 RepID=UPI002A82FE0C|nr:interferon alpha-inducible protein 27-like protein 2B [Saccostrea echinata]